MFQCRGPVVETLLRSERLFVRRVESWIEDVTQWASATCDPGPQSTSRLANPDMDVSSLSPSDYGPPLAADEREKFGSLC